ncbi:MAG: Lrp/AsnC family transcriptional regulator [Nanoarchaeota archaeon]|nr:Lrp/AsnC family transcriptional regulator [Nanoarchaeota archaeon]
MDKKDLMIVKELRRNARLSLTDIASLTTIPITTVHDRLKQHEKKWISKHTTLLDFQNMGYGGRAYLALKAEKAKRIELRNFLLHHKNVNSVYVVNYGFDLMADVVFRNIKDVESFSELLSQKYGVFETKIFHVLEELQEEEFMMK